MKEDFLLSISNLSVKYEKKSDLLALQDISLDVKLNSVIGIVGESSIALGASKSRVIFKHIIPHCTSIIIVAATNTLPSAIFLESFLSFLGLGISAPLVSLGSLCSDAITTLSISPFKMFFPSLVLTLIVFAFNLLGDYLRDHFDPRHQHQK